MDVPHFTSSTPAEHYEFFAEAIMQQAVRDAKEDGGWVPQALKDEIRMQVLELRMGAKSIGGGSNIRAVKVSGIIRAPPKVYLTPPSYSLLFNYIISFSQVPHLIYSHYNQANIQLLQFND